jgi:hypothetical protein
MAGFTGGIGAGESLNAAPLDADTSQQAFLTTPQHLLLLRDNLDLKSVVSSCQ